MAIRPSTPEIITVNSETLQTQIRDLLPSQNGFGSELQASNVITPIIDLTAAAEGSTLPISLQQALAFGSQTSTSVTATSTNIITSPGFYRVFGTADILGGAGGADEASIDQTDGVTTKELFVVSENQGGSNQYTHLPFDFIVWNDAGITTLARTSTVNSQLFVTVRQVADSEGNAVNPSGFPL